MTAAQTIDVTRKWGGKDDFGTVLIHAVRECLDSRPDDCFVVTDWVRTYCGGRLNLSTLVTMINDIEARKSRGELGNKVEQVSWMEFQKWLRRQFDLQKGRTGR